MAKLQRTTSVVNNSFSSAATCHTAPPMNSFLSFSFPITNSLPLSRSLSHYYSSYFLVSTLASKGLCLCVFIGILLLSNLCEAKKVSNFPITCLASCHVVMQSRGVYLYGKYMIGYNSLYFYTSLDTSRILLKREKNKKIVYFWV